MAIRLLPAPKWRFFDGNGNPAVGYKVYTYQPGTSTAKATYTDHTGNTENDNPVVLDARGEADIWFDGNLKVIVKDNNDVTVYSVDNYGEGTTSVLQGNFNLVKNGSFEQDTTGDSLPDDWTIVEYTDSGGVSLDSTEQIHGQYALKFISTGSGGGHATSDYFEVQESRVLPVGFAIKSSVAGVHNQIDVIWYTAAKAVISTTSIYDDTATNPTSWTYKTYTPTPPANARFARVRFFGCKDDDATSGTTWFDNVSAEKVAITTTHLPNVNGDVTATDEELNTMDGITASTSELNTMDGITASTSELNTMDGITASTSELNTMDGITASTAELNTMNGITASTAELNKMDGVTASTAEINYLDGATSGTVLTDGDTIDSDTVNSVAVYHGKVSSAGGLTEYNMTGWTASKTATGTYEITHNLDSGQVTVLPTTSSSGFAASHITNGSANTSEVKTFDTTTGTLTDREFRFICVK